MKTKIELINGKYYHVNQTCTKGVLIGNLDALLEYVYGTINDLSELREVFLMLYNKANALEKHLQKKQDLELENNKLKSEVNGLHCELKTLRTFVCDSLKNNDKGFCIIDFDDIDTLQKLDEILLAVKNDIKANKNLTDDQEDNEAIHALKKLRRMQWDKKPIDEANCPTDLLPKF